MTTFSTQWDSSYESTPVGGDDISLDWQVTTRLKEAIRERMEVDHIFGGAGSTDTEEGYHKAVHLKHQSAPSSVSGFGILYVDTSKRVRFIDADGNDAQLFHEDHIPTKSEIGLGSVTNDAQLKIASNLSDLDNAGTARNNLGLGSIATKDEGTGDSQFRDNAANDSRYAQQDGTYGSLRAQATTKDDVGLGNVPNTDATNADNIDSGTLASARLSGSYSIDVDTVDGFHISYDSGNKILNIDT